MRLLLICCALLLSATAIEPEVFEENGDIYLRSNGKVERLTTYGQNYAPELSPSKRFVVYRSMVRYACNCAPNPQIGNIWLVNLETRKASRIAKQRIEDLTAMFRQANSRKFFYTERGDPIWSSDGRFVVWAEWDYKSGRRTEQLSIYQVSNNKTLAFPVPIPSYGEAAPIPALLRWTPNGIVGVGCCTRVALYKPDFTRNIQDGVRLDFLVRTPKESNHWSTKLRQIDRQWFLDISNQYRVSLETGKVIQLP